MPFLQSIDSGASGAQADICPALLHGVQEYLRAQSRYETPDAHLKEAWQRFFQNYDPLIRRFVMRCNLPREHLDECVQEIWLKLIKALPAFVSLHCRSRFQSWLFAVVRNQTIDLMRRTNQCRANHLTMMIAAHLTADDADPAIQLEKSVDKESVLEIVDRLRGEMSEKSCQVLQLRWLEGRSVSEVANALKLTSAETRSLASRVKKRLAVLIRRDFNQQN